MEVAFLSGGRGGATETRARHLGIRHCLVGAGDKPAALEGLLAATGITSEAMAFVGDDINDLAVRRQTALLVATADAAAALRRQADLVLARPGGQGAVRELAEALLKRTPLWGELTRQGWRDRND